MSWFDTAYKQSAPPDPYPLCARTKLPEDCPPAAPLLRPGDLVLPAAWLAVVLVVAATVVGYRRLLKMLR